MAADKVHPGPEPLSGVELAEGHGRILTSSGSGVDAAVIEAILDELPVGIVVAEAASGRVTRANRYARELLGYELVGNEVVDAAMQLVRDAGGRSFSLRESPLARALIDGETVADYIVELAGADGEPRIVSATAKPLRDASGALIGAVALFEDVSGRYRRERVEGEFIANAAHELRTPLAAIASAIDVLQGGAKEVPVERDLFLDHIARESDRLQRLARALLLIARAEVQDEPPRMEIVALAPMLAEVADSLTPASGVEVSVHCHDDLAALTNRELLEQALLNVASNAVRYTERGSITLACRAEGEMAAIAVRDTGRGIAQAESGRVFERFFRGGGRDAQGFGLGLSIARNAVEAIGGRIALASTEGRGTTVEIRLPLARLVRS